MIFTQEIIQQVKGGSVKTLDFGRGEIDNTQIMELAEALHNNSSLVELRLHNCNLNNKAAKSLARTLENNHVLKLLDLRGNQIGNEGAAALFEALERNRTLEVFNLEDNKINTRLKYGDQFLQALTNMLRTNRTAQVLNISNNRLGDYGAMAMADGVAGNDSLAKLMIAHNNIGDDGVMALARAVENKDKITEINFEDNFNVSSMATQALSASILAAGSKNILKVTPATDELKKLCAANSEEAMQYISKIKYHRDDLTIEDIAQIRARWPAITTLSKKKTGNNEKDIPEIDTGINELVKSFWRNIDLDELVAGSGKWGNLIRKERPSSEQQHSL